MARMASSATVVPAYFAGISVGRDFVAAMGTQRLGLELGQRRQRPAGRVLTSSAATRPVNTIAAGSGIVELAAGAEHMLALKSDGTVVAWAYNLGCRRNGALRVTECTGGAAMYQRGRMRLCPDTRAGLSGRGA